MNKRQRWDLVFQIAGLVDDETGFGGKQDFLADFLKASLVLFLSTTDGKQWLAGLKVKLAGGATAIPLEAIPVWYAQKFHARTADEGVQYEAYCALNALVKDYL